ncbi:Williams-Beuren syndrome chromosome region 16 protein [Rhodotorula kratochvilovae]
MAVLACGSNAFHQLADSDDLALSHVVPLPNAVSLEAASWSQSLVRDSAGELRCLGLPLSGNIPSSRVKRWLGHDQLEATLDDRGVVRFFEGAAVPETYEIVEINGRGEFIAETTQYYRNGRSQSIRDRTVRIYDDLSDALSQPQYSGVPLPLPIDPQLFGLSGRIKRNPYRPFAVAAGAAHFLVLVQGGPHWVSSVHAFGDVRYGQGGAGAPPPREENGRIAHPAALRRLAFFDGLGPRRVSCGAFHSAVLTSQGGAYVFGSNKDGQLGIGTAPGGAEPVLVELPDEGEDEEIVQVAGGGAHTVVLTKSRQVWVAGANHDGQLGLGDFLPRRTWVRNLAAEEAARACSKRIKRVVCTRASTYFECA